MWLQFPFQFLPGQRAVVILARIRDVALLALAAPGMRGGDALFAGRAVAGEAVVAHEGFVRDGRRREGMGARPFARKVQPQKIAAAKQANGFVRTVDVALLALRELRMRHGRDGLLAFLDARFASVTFEAVTTVAVAGKGVGHHRRRAEKRPVGGDVRAENVRADGLGEGTGLGVNLNGAPGRDGRIGGEQERRDARSPEQSKKPESVGCLPPQPDPPLEPSGQFHIAYAT